VALLRFASVYCLLLMLAACGALPSNSQRDASQAIDPGVAAQTRLGRVAQASLVDDAFASGFRLLQTGHQGVDTRLALVQQAERSIDAQYYLIQNDASGRAFLSALLEAADRGVRVRLLVDDLFTIKTDSLLRALASRPNMEVRLFNPFGAGRATLSSRVAFSIFDFSRINRRMHNKLLVVDNSVAVSGGRNIADEYFNDHLNSNFIDLDVLSAGAVVPELSNAFDLYWNYALSFSVQDITGALDSTTSNATLLALQKSQHHHITTPTLTVAPGDARVPEISLGELNLTGGQGQVFVDRPQKVEGLYDSDLTGTVNRSFLEALRTARTEIVMMSPYFIPLERHIDLLAEAVQRKIRIVVVTNSIGSTDEPLVYAAYAKRRKALLKSGVELLEINPQAPAKDASLGHFRSVSGGLHTKAALIDRQSMFVGSLNLDARSAYSNTELGLLIHSPELTQQFSATLRSSRVPFRLRLNAQDEIEWVSTVDGQERIDTSEPNLNWWTRIKLFIQSAFVPESLL
jgi:putative cardiolipin synthase